MADPVPMARGDPLKIKDGRAGKDYHRNFILVTVPDCLR